MLDNKQILLGDPDEKSRKEMINILYRSGAKITEVKDGREVLEQFTKEKNTFHLIIMESILPEFDGRTVCREIRKHSSVPIIFVTNNTSEFDEICSFEAGADDFIKKPINRQVFLARIQAVMARSESAEKKGCYEYGDLFINDPSHFISVKGEEILLSPKEYKLLLILVSQAGRIISRDELLRKVWGYDYLGGSRTVDTHMNRLKKKLKNSGDSISTVRGFGYRFEYKTP